MILRASLLRSKLGTLLRAGKGMLCGIFDIIPPFPTDQPLEVIGKTVQGKEINMVRIGNGPIKIIFCGAIHGNEVGTARLIRFLAAYLGEVTYWHTQFTFFCIGTLNRDGYEMALRHPDYLHGGRIGRLNANGVDLNRNFPTASFASHSVWSHGKNFRETTKVFCGTSPGSEPENVTLRSLIAREKIKLLWMFHSVASEIMASGDALGQHLAYAFSQATGFHQASDEEWQTLGQTGTAKEWCEENGVVYLESEASERWGSDWKRQKPGIEAVLETLRWTKRSNSGSRRDTVQHVSTRSLYSQISTPPPNNMPRSTLSPVYWEHRWSA